MVDVNYLLKRLEKEFQEQIESSNNNSSKVKRSSELESEDNINEKGLKMKKADSYFEEVKNEE